MNSFVSAFTKVDGDEVEVKNPGTRLLSHTKLRQYLSSLNESDRAFVKDVASAAQYVPWPNLIYSLNQSFDQFAKQIGQNPFYVFVPSYKFGSEFLLVAKLFPRIRQLSFQGFITPDTALESNADILIIDDCIYSGTNVSSIIDNIGYNNKNKNLTLTYHLVIPYVGKAGVKNIDKLIKSLSLEIHPYPVMILHYYSILSLTPFSHVYPQYPEEQYRRFKLEYMDHVPIYFDHKIGNEFATFSTIYSALIENPPDTDIKMRIWQKYFKDVAKPPS